jgi:hypothetical protein
MGNSESRNKHSEENQNLEKNANHNQWHNAVKGNTEEIQVSSPRANVNHATFETTSDNENFTVTEELKPVAVIHENVSYPNHVKKNNTDLLGGLFSKLSNLLQDTEMDGGVSDNVFINSKLSQIRELLQDTEMPSQLGGNISEVNHIERLKELLQETETNNLVGGFDSNNNNLVSINPMINKIRELLLQETETNIVNFKGGALNNENLFSENKSTESKKKEHVKVEKRELDEIHVESEKHENLNTDQSGGEELDTELKNILVELQSNKNKHTGGKSSRKGSKKSSKKSGSKRQSRRSSEASEASNNTYNIGDSDESDVEDYLSTSSMNTSDINIKHYRS